MVDFLFHERQIADRIYFIQDWNDNEIFFLGQFEIGESLSLDALSGINHQQGSLTSSHRSFNLIMEIYVAGSVYKIQEILLAFVFIIHWCGLGLHCYPSLSLDFQLIQVLIWWILRNCVCDLEQSVRESGFAMIDVCYYAKIAYKLRLILFAEQKPDGPIHKSIDYNNSTINTMLKSLAGLGRLLQFKCIRDNQFFSTERDLIYKKIIST